MALGEFEQVDLPDGATLLSGHVADQAALHGVLARIRDLGIPLLAVRVADGPGSGEAAAVAARADPPASAGRGGEGPGRRGARGARRRDEPGA
jgi:hypothetical protein